MLGAVASVLALPQSMAAAQQPGRPITIIVPYAAGANTPDIVARIVGQEAQRRLGQPVVVDNKPGASGNIGTQIAARAAPDGHTLLMVAPAFAQNVGLFKKVPYDPVRDFAPIVQTSAVSNALVAHPSLPVNSAREFVDYVKARPGQLNYSSPGHGTPHHLSMELFKIATAIDIKHIPYKGLNVAVQDLVGGHVSAMFLPLPVSLPLAKAGKIKFLAVAEERRAGVAPDLPTLTEQGITGVDVGIWIGLLAPAATPRVAVDRYYTLVNEILQLPEIAGKMEGQGINIVGGSAAQFGALIEKDIAKWLRVVKEAGIGTE
jgi:tripartite-type tricarboxylate transporter receptor subunit TctC